MWYVSKAFFSKFGLLADGNNACTMTQRECEKKREKQTNHYHFLRCHHQHLPLTINDRQPIDRSIRDDELGPRTA